MSRPTSQYSASDIARWFIAWSDELDAGISSLKLQKLLYYAQGWFLAQHDRPLFRDKIKAWAHGPVVPSVWHEYKKYGKNSIDVDVIGDDFNWDDFSDVNSFLVSIYSRYGQYEAWALREMTHRESPWRDAFNGPGESREIPVGSIKTYFKTIA